MDNLYQLEQKIRERQRETDRELEHTRTLRRLAGDSRETGEAQEPVAIRARLGHLLVRVGTRLAA